MIGVGTRTRYMENKRNKLAARTHQIYHSDSIGKSLQRVWSGFGEIVGKFRPGQRRRKSGVQTPTATPLHYGPRLWTGGHFGPSKGVPFARGRKLPNLSKSTGNGPDRCRIVQNSGKTLAGRLSGAWGSTRAGPGTLSPSTRREMRKCSNWQRIAWKRFQSN
jgi:hypothetical protein